MRGILIGLAGPARVGKSTAAELLAGTHGLTVMSFADPIREAARAVFNHWTTWHLKGPGKDLIDPASGRSPRTVLQDLGDWGRGLDQALWINLAFRRIQIIEGTADQYVKPWVGVCFDDVRTEPEAAFIRESGGTVVHMRRHAAQPVRSHPTERFLRYEPGDFSLWNDCSIASLRVALDDVVTPLLRAA